MSAPPTAGQEKSVKPGINKPYENPKIPEFIKKFESNNREAFANRQKIVAACKLKPGMAVADIGAGTGLFTMLLSKEVGPTGKVYAVEIIPQFIEHIEKTCKEKKIKNVTGVLCTPTSTKLPPTSADVVLICDAYHHFEYPFKTMASIHQALRDGGRVVLVDFKRIEGVTKEETLKHVRAGQETVTKEVESTGFKLVAEPFKLKDNYCIVFEKEKR
jgi:predicted methyltransferase